MCRPDELLAPGRCSHQEMYPDFAPRAATVHAHTDRPHTHTQAVGHTDTHTDAYTRDTKTKTENGRRETENERTKVALREPILKPTRSYAVSSHYPAG